MADDEAATAFDYLGRPQPLAPPRINVAGGGGGITAPVTPSVPQRAAAAHAISQNAMAQGSSGNLGSEILGGVGMAKTGIEWAKKIADLFPSGTTPPPLGGGGIEGTTGSGGELPAIAEGEAAGEGVASGAGAAASGLSQAAGAAGQALPYVGAALGFAQDIMGNKSNVEKGVDAAIDVAAAAAIPATFGLSELAVPALKSVASREIKDITKGDWLQAIIDLEPIMAGIHAIEDMFKGGGPFGLFGKPQLTHAQREAKDLSTHIEPGAVGFQNSLAKAPSLDALWSAIVAGGSGTTGGTSGVATSVSLPMSHEAFAAAVKAGEIVLPQGQSVEKFLADHGDKPLSVVAGQPNANYPVFTQPGFFKALEANAGSLHAGVQAGVEPGKLSEMNQGLAGTILQQYAHLRPQPSAPTASMSAMPARGVDFGGPEGSLPFAQDIVTNRGP